MLEYMLENNSFDRVYLLDPIVDAILVYIENLRENIDDYDRIKYIIDIECRGDSLTKMCMQKSELFSIWKKAIECNKECLLVESDYIYIPNYSFLLKYDGDHIRFNLKYFYDTYLYDGFSPISELMQVDDFEYLIKTKILEKIKIPEENDKIIYVNKCTKNAIKDLDNNIKKSKMILSEFIGDNKINVIKYL